MIYISEFNISKEIFSSGILFVWIVVLIGTRKIPRPRKTAPYPNHNHNPGGICWGWGWRAILQSKPDIAWYSLKLICGEMYWNNFLVLRFLKHSYNKKWNKFELNLYISNERVIYYDLSQNYVVSYISYNTIVGNIRFTVNSKIHCVNNSDTYFVASCAVVLYWRLL